MGGQHYTTALGGEVTELLGQEGGPGVVKVALGFVDKQGLGRLIELGRKVDALALARRKVADRGVPDGVVDSPKLMNLGKVYAGAARKQGEVLADGEVG